MMKNNILLLPGLIIIIASGCLPVNSTETKLVLTRTPIPTHQTSTSTRMIQAETLEPTQPTLSPISTVETSSPQTPTEVPTFRFDQDPKPIDFTGEEFSSCIGHDNLSEHDIRSGKGLVIFNRTNRTLEIWGEQGFQQPAYSIQDSPGLVLGSYDSIVSPDHEWLYYMYRPALDLFDVWVLNPKTGEQIQKHFEGITLAGSPGPYWAGPSHLVFPLKFGNDLFNWMVWNPFKGETGSASTHLPGIGTSYERTHIPPRYDPQTELVIYSCDACGDDDFRAYHIPSQRVIWAIDFGGVFHDPILPPIWSQNGETIVFYLEMNKIWAVSRNGESIFKTILPFGSSERWPITALELSPDGKKLAMIRDSKDPSSPYLSIISFDKRKLVNMCASFYYGSLGWSYDNARILYIRQRQAGDTESIIAILDTTTGDGWQSAISENLFFNGWLKP